MDTQGWIVVGEKQHRSIYIEQVRAVEQACKHHGVARALVLADDVSLMLKQTYEQGVREGIQIGGQQEHSA